MIVNGGITKKNSQFLRYTIGTINKELFALFLRSWWEQRRCLCVDLLVFNVQCSQGEGPALVSDHWTGEWTFSIQLWLDAFIFNPDHQYQQYEFSSSPSKHYINVSTSSSRRYDLVRKVFCLMHKQVYCLLHQYHHPWYEYQLIPDNIIVMIAAEFLITTTMYNQC